MLSIDLCRFVLDDPPTSRPLISSMASYKASASDSAVPVSFDVLDVVRFDVARPKSPNRMESSSSINMLPESKRFGKRICQLTRHITHMNTHFAGLRSLWMTLRL